MKLNELVKYLIGRESLQKLFSGNKDEEEIEDTYICMENELNINSELHFFSSEETDDEMEFEIDNKKYYSLFSIHYTIELIESDLNLLNKGYTDLQIAERLLEYRIYDA